MCPTRTSSVLITSQLKNSAYSSCLIRTYTTTCLLRINKVPLPDPHSSGRPEDWKATKRKYRPILKRTLPKHLNLDDENARSKAEIHQRASEISKTWSASDSLIESAFRSENHGISTDETATDMTTNFMIYLPHRITHRTPENPRLDKSRIMENLQVLLLKRNPLADPFPNGWTAISGRLEAGEDGVLESPINGALREIKEETNLDPVLFELKIALPPFLIQSPGSKTWRVWPLLWHRELPHDRHGFPLDEIEGLLDLKEKAQFGSLINYSIKLNDENVEFRWTKWTDMNALPGLVSGLTANLERLVDKWIEKDDSRNEYLISSHLKEQL